MLQDFIKKLPFDLKIRINKEYDNRIREFEYIIKRYDKKYKWIETEKDKDSIKFLLLLGIFYRTVIDPIKGSADFGKTLESQNSDGLLAGSNTYNPGHFKNFEILTNEFIKILNKYSLNKRIFDYESVSDFLDIIWTIYIGQEYE